MKPCPVGLQEMPVFISGSVFLYFEITYSEHHWDSSQLQALYKWQWHVNLVIKGADWSWRLNVSLHKALVQPSSNNYLILELLPCAYISGPGKPSCKVRQNCLHLVSYIRKKKPSVSFRAHCFSGKHLLFDSCSHLLCWTVLKFSILSTAALMFTFRFDCREKGLRFPESTFFYYYFSLTRRSANRTDQ